ncbi:MAG: hypothetical protein M0Z91_03200 [Actinomycetota bacterium]|nr:hypothetical protein [Actinomycetota bacterium]
MAAQHVVDPTRQLTGNLEAATRRRLLGAPPKPAEQSLQTLTAICVRWLRARQTTTYAVTINYVGAGEQR